MSTTKKRSPRTSSLPLTVGDVSKETGARFNVPSNTKLTKYFIDRGVPGLAKILEEVKPKPSR